MTLILGEFVETLPCEKESIVAEFSFSCNLLDSEDFERDFQFGQIVIYMLGAIYPRSLNVPTEKSNKIKEAIDYIVNELLENSTKYGDRFTPNIAIKFCVTKKRVFITSTNPISKTRAKSFQSYIQRVLTSDVEELYLRQLEDTIHNQESRIGLLSIIKDYRAKMGWKFETQNHSGQIFISVMVQFPIKEI